jgi:hypothetical protein
MNPEPPVTKAVGTPGKLTPEVPRHRNRGTAALRQTYQQWNRGEGGAMFRRTGLLALVLALVSPAAASAGGYATVGLQSLPTDVEPGKPWMAEFTVLIHGRTPFLDGNPTVTVSRNGRVFGPYPAKLVNHDGLYRAAVVFPSRGRFNYVIDDGYSQRHMFPPVVVRGEGSEPAAPAAATAPAEDDAESLPLALVLSVGVGFLTAWILLMVLSRRSHRGRPALDG